MNSKRQHGQYFTKNNPFVFPVFTDWFKKARKNNTTPILEPFAGSNQIPLLISIATDYNDRWSCYDIDPTVLDRNVTDHHIEILDVLSDFPTDHKIIITNPPYLAKNSATRRGLKFPLCNYDDIYKFCIEKCLDNADYVAAIIPESFIVQGLFLNRLESVISLTDKMFDDTECPVCLALFSPFSEDVNFDIYSNDIFLGTHYDLSKKIINSPEKYDLKFNDPNGEISVFAIDNNTEASIYFDFGYKINPEKIKHTSRAFTRIKLPFCFTEEELRGIIYLCEELLLNMRNETKDVFMTAFKGLRKDGKYRRRLDFQQIRNIISYAIFSLHKNK